MLHLKLKSFIILLAVGFIAGLCSSLVFQGCSSDSTAIAQKITSSEDLKKEAASIEVAYQIKTTELKNKNEQLQEQLRHSRLRLTTIKSRTRQRENKIKKIITPDSYPGKGFPARELLKKTKSITQADNLPLREESVQVLFPCDTLLQEISEYIQETVLKDSIYESQAALQDSVIIVKDSVITLRSRQYQELQCLFDETVEQQETLAKENKHLRKTFKRQKFKSTLKTVGLIILSGAATNFIMNH